MKQYAHTPKLMKNASTHSTLFHNNRMVFAQELLEAGEEKAKEILRKINDEKDDLQTDINLPRKKRV